MEPKLIDHIGILVPDMEEAIERWSAATGYTFSPITRYRTPRYVDHSDPEPHFHDARMSFSREGNPKIELLEVTGTGTHSREHLGIHHLALVGYDDLESEADRMVSAGFEGDGWNTDETGAMLLWFTRKQDLDGLRLELVSRRIAPIVHDDGSPAGVDPTTGRRSMWVPKEGSGS
jgi:catechol 2,3-dioxygenase-like lactoylglutathione lyase family enzyme